MKAIGIMCGVVVAALLSGCGYNHIQTQDEAVKAAWSEVVNQYQRRADLVPNLVNTVKGYAAQEKSVLLGVTEARAKVGTIQATPELVNDEAAFKKFQAAQGELTAALKSLIAVSENYPQLKSDQNFRDLQAQLEGTENRITVARNRYIDAVRAYNVTIRSFPSNLTAMIFKYQAKPNFAVENEAAIAKPADGRLRHRRAARDAARRLSSGAHAQENGRACPAVPSARRRTRRCLAAFALLAVRGAAGRRPRSSRFRSSRRASPTSPARSPPPSRPSSSRS